MEPQDVIADAIVDPDLFGESIVYLASGSLPMTLDAMVERDNLDPGDSDAGALGLTAMVYIRRSDLGAITEGRDRVQFEWRGVIETFVVDRVASDDEALWHLQVKL